MVDPENWQGNEGWVEAFKLYPYFAEKIDSKIPLFFYHCIDDEEVPIAQLAIYKQKLPWVALRA